MKTTADFLDDLRARHGLTSDSKLALHMGWERAQLGKYRSQKESFSDQTALKVAAQLGVDPGYVIACMHGQRARTPETRSAWEQIAAKVAAAVLIAAFDKKVLAQVQIVGVNCTRRLQKHTHGGAVYPFYSDRVPARPRPGRSTHMRQFPS